MEDEFIQKIHKLTNELASQQQSNQDLASNLTFQVSDLKSKASTKCSADEEQVQIPNPLLPEKRDEVLESLKERLEKSLKEQETTSLANKQLENEVEELRSLLKEYESGLETVTSKLRAQASASTEGQIRLRREYEALLNAEKGTTAALFIENTMLQTQLRNLSKSLREVYKNEAVDLHEQEIFQLKKENQELLNLLNISKLSSPAYQKEQEKPSPVLQVVKSGVVEEFFNE